MPEYRNARLEKSQALSEQSRQAYERGVSNRETGDEYVRITVVLATVLLLTALSQRFRLHAARVGLIAVSSILLIVAISWIATFPRA
jgi:Na+/H+ antiporter NhaB